MKSEVCEKKVTPAYPILKKHRTLHFVVMFFAPCKGVVVAASPYQSLGQVSDTWDEPSCDVFTGNVTLSNECC